MLFIITGIKEKNKKFFTGESVSIKMYFASVSLKCAKVVRNEAKNEQNSSFGLYLTGWRIL